MIGELLAFFVGRSVGRNERPRRRRKATSGDIAMGRLVALLVLVCWLAILLVGSH